MLCDGAGFGQFHAAGDGAGLRFHGAECHPPAALAQSAWLQAVTQWLTAMLRGLLTATDEAGQSASCRILPKARQTAVGVQAVDCQIQLSAGSRGSVRKLKD